MEKYLNTSLYADCSSRVYDCGRRPPGASTCRQILRWRPLTSLEVLWRLQTPGPRLRGVAPLTDGDDTVVDVLRQRCGVNIIKYSERDKIMSFLHDVGTCAIGLKVIFHSFW